MTERLIVLDNAQIEKLLKTPKIVREFQFLVPYAAKLNAKKSGCGGCGAKQRGNVLDYEGVKTAIGQLPVEQKTRLRQLLDTQQVRVKFKNARGQTVRQTF